jgi:hypothetical protein
MSETGVEVAELFFHNGVREFVREVLDDKLEVLLTGDSCVPDHFIKGSPDHRPEERVFD